MAFEPTKCFRLYSVKLKSASFATSSDLDEIEFTPKTVATQTRRWFEYQIAKIADAEHDELRTTINLGIRAVKKAEDGSLDTEGAVEVIYAIDASFGVDFFITSTEYVEEDLDHFVTRNAIHVAWPFWREHVFGTLRAASLPLVEVPLMTGVSTAKQETPQIPVDKT